MKSQNISILAIFFILIAAGCSTNIQEPISSDVVTSYLQQEFDLAGERPPEKQYYFMETELVHFSLDGKRTGIKILRLWLEYAPSRLSGNDQDEYICRKFTVQMGTEPPASIPSLEGWSYIYTFGQDDGGQVFGIDHSKFENLKTDDGKSLPPDVSYFVYNTFIDFHGFCNIFAERIEGGNGIQDLKIIGSKIIHAASYTEPPVNLGSNVAEGSTFKNGEVTLEFKGISLVDDRICSVVAFDSGESSFNMIMKPIPEMEIKTVGGSHYKGDLFIDLESYWVRKVVMGEIVISETILPMPPHKINAVIERTSVIKSVSEKEFSQT
jgi:hypothetical protein